MCINFINLNKGCPKDSHPLPSIDMLVDSASRNEVLTMMGDHSDYNQILMAKKDEEKTTFVTDWDTYCYRVMSFGLCNAGATFQNLVDTVFENQIGRNVLAYVNDILVKLSAMESHPKDLGETLETLRTNDMKLNLVKCSFGVLERKFLGFYVDKDGIKPN